MQAPLEVDHTQTSVTLKWVAPVSDGASPVTKYIVYHKADYMTSYSEVYAGMTESHQVTGLRTGFSHFFKV
jgi:hypothetical protein